MVRDGVRFLLIIFKIASLYSPLKLFAPTAVAFFLAALGWYGYTFATQGRLTRAISHSRGLFIAQGLHRLQA